MIKKVLIPISMFVFILMSFTIKAKANSLQTDRLWGNNRYETCSKIVDKGWQTSDYAIIVSGENFPDALSASTLARKYKAPIILTEGNNLDTNARYQLDRLNVKSVFIVGGKAVIGSIVESQLRAMNINTQRIFGEDRYATSIAVAEQIGTDNGIILTTGDDYTDALSVAPIAGKLQIPIILMPKDSIPSSVSNFIAARNIPKTYILGGSDLISDNVAGKFANVQRIDGYDKYDRNYNIIKYFANEFDFSNAYLVYSEGFADALSGSALAALNCNPIILQLSNLESDAYTINLISNNSIKRLCALGGTAGISDEALNDLSNRSKALFTVESKVKINKNLRLGIAQDLQMIDGTKYYWIMVYSQRGGCWLDDYYPYAFIVNTSTGVPYKIERETNEITPLDDMKIGVDN